MPPEPQVIDIARDFSATPGGRYRREGDWSGEEFRERILEPALASGGDVVIDLDEVEGFTTSFLDEVFGELVRRHGLEIMKRVSIHAVKRPSRGQKVAELAQQAETERRAKAHP